MDYANCVCKMRQTGGSIGRGREGGPWRGESCLLTDNTQVQEYRCGRMCGHLTLIDAGIAQLHKFDLQCPILQNERREHDWTINKLSNNKNNNEYCQFTQRICLLQRIFITYTPCCPTPLEFAMQLEWQLADGRWQRGLASSANWQQMQISCQLTSECFKCVALKRSSLL